MFIFMIDYLKHLSIVLLQIQQQAERLLALFVLPIDDNNNNDYFEASRRAKSIYLVK
jgi:hypothetical protein